MHFILYRYHNIIILFDYLTQITNYNIVLKYCTYYYFIKYVKICISLLYLQYFFLQSLKIILYPKKLNLMVVFSLP